MNWILIGNALRKILKNPYVVGAICGVVLLWSATVLWTNALDRSYERGRQDAFRVAESRIDTVVITKTLAAVDTAKAKTDTVRIRVVERIAEVDSQAHAVIAMADALPPAIADHPQVIELKAAITTLHKTAAAAQQEVTQLERAMASERAASRDAINALREQLTYTQLAVSARDDAIRQLQERPTWKLTLVTNVVSAGLGAAAGWASHR